MLCLPALAGGVLRFNLAGEPKTLDPHLSTGVLENYVIYQLIEGLMLVDEKGNAKPGMAEKWAVSEDGTSYTFTLRQATWSNGDPVTAQDFVYGWRRCLDPKTAAEYAYQLYPLKGAQEFNTGRSADPGSIGAVAESDRVLTVHLNHPTPYFLPLLSHYAFAPLNEKWVTAHPDWSANPSAYLVNGPFKLKEWRHRDRIILEKNPGYYNAGTVGLDAIDMSIIANESTALLQYETGKLDLLVEVPLPDLPRLKTSKEFHTVPYLGTYYIALNNGQKPFNDARVRKAFAIAIDRTQITRAILRGGQPEAFGIIPPGIEMTGAGDYRKTTGNMFSTNVAEAKKLLAEAGYPNGRGLPPVKYLYNDMEMHRTIAEAMQRMWQVNLGVRVTLQVQEYKTYLQTLHSKNYQMARAGWIADFSDPMAFLDMYESGAGNNNFAYSNAAFDKLLESIRATADPAKRLQQIQSAEKILIGQDMAVIPLYYYVKQYLAKPVVKGVLISPTGTIDFRGVSVN